MADINLVQGSGGKVLLYRMLVPDTSGRRLVALDLTQATGIRFRLWPRTACGGSLLGGVGAVYGTPSQGGVSYTLADADIKDSGLYWATFEADFPGGSRVTVPEGRYLSVSVMPRLGAQAG